MDRVYVKDLRTTEILASGGLLNAGVGPGRHEITVITLSLDTGYTIEIHTDKMGKFLPGMGKKEGQRNGD